MHQADAGPLPDQVGFVRRHPSEAACHSAIMQALMATVARHSLGMMHEDLHGNVLYHKVSTRGSWRYKLSRAEFSIPNCGRLWVLWDFDQASFMDHNAESRTHGCMSDFTKLLTLCLPLLPRKVAKSFEGLLSTVMPQNNIKNNLAILATVDGLRLRHLHDSLSRPRPT